MAIGMKSISNYDYLRYMIAASREISDEPKMSTPKFLTILGGISLEIYLVHGLFVIEYAKLISNAWFYEIMVCASTLIFAYILNTLNRSVNN
jgi:peptidoglycan/LPS O-acetylase OafA/YrhL